jgi:hypothetical protein
LTKPDPLNAETRAGLRNLINRRKRELVDPPSEDASRVPNGCYLQPGHLLRSFGIRDVDGSFLSAEVLLTGRWSPLFDEHGRHRGKPQERLDINFGKRRNPATKPLARLEGEGTLRKVAEDRVSTVYDKPTPQRNYPVPLGDLGAQLVDYLAAGGWRVEKAGATGGKRGKPPKGISGPKMIDAKVLHIFRQADGWLAEVFVRLAYANEFGLQVPLPYDTNGRKGRARKAAWGLAIACVLNAGVNTKAFADMLGMDESYVRSLRRYGEDWINKNMLYLLLFLTRDRRGQELPLPNTPANSPKGGREEEVNATALADLRTEMREMHDEQMRALSRIELRQLDELERDRDETETLED